jgi:hypothetical protein
MQNFWPKMFIYTRMFKKGYILSKFILELWTLDYDLQLWSNRLLLSDVSFKWIPSVSVIKKVDFIFADKNIKFWFLALYHIILNAFSCVYLLFIHKWFSLVHSLHFV